MEIGDLVTVRLNETGTSRILLPGIIIHKFKTEKRMMYDILTRGETVTVSDSDLGPIDMVIKR